MKIGYQLKQVRERLAKGLVDKGVLRTEKRNFLLFDMATHPVSDASFKEDVLRRTLSLLTARTAAVPTTDLYSETVRYRTVRAVAMVCAAFAANVLENALVHLSYDARELAMQKCDELLAEFSQWPFAIPRGGTGVGVGSGGSDATSANLAEISRLARAELSAENELQMEIVAAVLHVFGKMCAPPSSIFSWHFADPGLRAQGFSTVTAVGAAGNRDSRASKGGYTASSGIAVGSFFRFGCWVVARGRASTVVQRCLACILHSTPQSAFALLAVALSTSSTLVVSFPRHHLASVHTTRYPPCTCSHLCTTPATSCEPAAAHSSTPCFLHRRWRIRRHDESSPSQVRRPSPKSRYPDESTDAS